MKAREDHVIISSSVSILCFVTLIVLGHSINWLIYSDKLPTALLSTAGIFIGFIITALGIYVNIPIATELKDKLKKQGFYQQIIRNFIISLFVFVVVILFNIIAILIYNQSKYLLLQHWINSISISLFINGLLLLAMTCYRFMVIIIKGQ